LFVICDILTAITIRDAGCGMLVLLSSSHQTEGFLVALSGLWNASTSQAIRIE